MNYFCAMLTRKTSSADRAVGYWVLAGTIMLMIQVMLGGITRLTGSGLSITEWNIFTGALPPLTGDRWVKEFDKYKQTPQFQIINSGFGLSEFKFIFFWEWFHRFWARLVGVVFLVGFVWLLFKRKINSRLIIPLLILFLLGLLQAVIGWIMVVSGLTGDAIYVKPTKLALHFIFAIGLISYAFWLSLQLLLPPMTMRKSARIWRFSLVLFILVFLQLLYGALMAGNKAAAAAPGWPLINGQFFPDSLFREKPLALNFIGNVFMIHFIHRNLAYLILLGVMIWTWGLFRAGLTGPGKNGLLLPIGLVFLQVLLGIAALMTSPSIVANHWGAFDCVALLHQVNGMLLLFSLIYAIFQLRPVAK